MSEWDDDGGFDIPPEQYEAIKKGRAYAQLARTDGYIRLLDYLESRSEIAIKAMKESGGQDDRVNAMLMMVWRESEKVLEDVQLEVQRGIQDGQEAASELDTATATRFGIPIDFSGGN